MERRDFLKFATGGAVGGFLPGESRPLRSEAALAEPMKITRIRFYQPPVLRPIFNQSAGIVTIETDQGIIGIGEGGTRETIEQAGAMLIGEDPSRIGHLWQMMFRGYFYPAGREKLHALGALDMALWDIRGKALKAPLHELLGGMARDHVECYSTGFPNKGSVKETARACIEAGFRAYRTSIADPGGGRAFDAPRIIRKTLENCREIREGVGPDGDWAIDFHTRLEPAEAVRLGRLIEDLEPLFAEDLVRSENPGVYRMLRPQIKVPIAVGEQFGARWDLNEMVEQHLIDHSRVTIPNCGGITEFLRIAGLCETHYVGLIPHFTGPVSTAALVHACGASSTPVLMEMTGAGPREEAHLPQHFDFKDGKLWPNSRPGLGVEFDPKGATQVLEITKNVSPIRMLRRRDGSYTNW
jgi:galactonate dehydratase